jgi:hypothetical protein
MTEQITIRDRGTGEDHSGVSPEAIARELWGDDVRVVYSGDPTTRWEAHVVYTDQHGTHIVTNLTIDEAARAAAETPDNDDPHDPLLVEVRAASVALDEAEARRLAAVRAAFDAGRDRSAIAEAAGKTRDWVYKALRA